MAIVVVGGSGRGVGKTALVCGLIRALPEIPWTAVKITNDAHAVAKPIFEETDEGQKTDTSRYLAAGARRALLVTAGDDTLSDVVERVLSECPAPAGVIFESNSVLGCVRADLCLAAASSPFVVHKPSFNLVLEHMDAMVELAGHDHVIEGERLAFRLKRMEQISPVMLEWVRERLGTKGPGNRDQGIENRE
ncbi:MAG: hypothetical protein ABSB50_07845 [Terracidiphilus sp.]